MAQGRTPLDLLSAELAGFLRPSATGGGTSTDVFAWGNGANYGLVRPADLHHVTCSASSLRSANTSADAQNRVSLAANVWRSMPCRAYEQHPLDGQQVSAACPQGTGSTSVATAPARLDALRRLRVTTVAAAKFHSVALIEDGRLFSWGFGRGGRTGDAVP